VPKPARDFTGLRIGSLVAVERRGKTPHGKKLWLVRCDCGNERVLDGTKFAEGDQKSCGCRRSALVAASRKTHGMSKHPAYAVWSSMHDRCRLPTHHAWQNYGGRGIAVDAAWDTFEAFWGDMSPTYVPGLSLDRIDNSLGYSAANCRWADRKTQARNKRGNLLIDTAAFGRVTVKEAAERAGLNYTTLLYRLDAGCPVELALTLPPDATRDLP
jgi:hypothetical protein